jgi:hypothetical protein
MNAAMMKSTGIPLVIIVTLLGAWEYSKPRYPKIDESSVLKSVPADPPPPRNANEGLFQDVRRTQRASALQTLERPWASHCLDSGRKRLASSLGEYFWNRSAQEKSYPARWGDVGRDYITREWSTTDDKRIERLTQELYERGYLDLRDLRPYTADYIAGLLKGIRVTARPCTS